jgi:cytochrome d ubiquinol oxidase subunit I
LSYLLELKPRLDEPVLGLKEWAPEDRPHQVGLVYYSFRTMIAIGMFLAALAVVTMLQWLRGQLSEDKIADNKWLLRTWIFSAPLGYIAVETGWIVRCVGRQPWIVYGELRTVEQVSNIPPGEVLFSLSGLSAFYIVFFIAFIFFGSRIIRRGPNLELPLPEVQLPRFMEAEHEPDSRPVEAQQ